jgi:hypothetical protein
MKLQDYIHYYHGCDFIANGMRYKVACIDKRIKGTRFNPFGREVWNDFELHKIKPILRRLADMTEEEAVRVHREATKTPFLPADKDEYDVTYIKDKGEVCSIQVVDLRMPKMHTNINIEGDVLVYIHEHNEEPKICERVANQHHITHYLLTQHFDLFGLIDAGLAIDEKTLTQ